MDFQRSNPHFQLSQDPPREPVDSIAQSPGQVIQPAAPAIPAEPVVPAPEPQLEMTNDETTAPLAFEPAPPAVPAVAPPVIESMQTNVEPVTEQAVPEPQIAEPQVESHVLPKFESKPSNGIPTKRVVAGGAAMLVLLIGSIVWQQMTISDLKTERGVLSEQILKVDPISVGAGASEPDKKR